jgi:hypothetical protein
MCFEVIKLDIICREDNYGQFIATLVLVLKAQVPYLVMVSYCVVCASFSAVRGSDYRIMNRYISQKFCC